MHNQDIEYWAEQARHLLELINPVDPERAEAQHETFLSELAVKDEDELDSTVALMHTLQEVIVGEASFQASWRGKVELIEALEALLPEPELRIDWGGDSEDEDFLAAVTVPQLLRRAFLSLQDAGYTLWCWNSESDSYVGWISRSVDETQLVEVYYGLGLDVRLAEDLG